MPLTFASFPFATEYDPVEDPPGSIDPMGTLTGAERLADVLLPGFTARMYRPRLLTMAVVAAAVADQVVEELQGQPGLHLEARLAFERLVAYAFAKKRTFDPTAFKEAARRLPGTLLAQRAMSVGEPLTTVNFLRGQAVNGASGVIMRLARRVGLIDDDGHTTGTGRELLLEWAREEGLAGVFDDRQSRERPGARWMRDMAAATQATIAVTDWPRIGVQLWEELFDPLRLDRISAGERSLLLRLLKSEAEPLRARLLDLLEHPATLEAYRAATSLGRGGAERAALVKGVLRDLKSGPVDNAIATTIEALEAYELAAGFFQQAFDAVVFALKRHGGRAKPEALAGHAAIKRHLDRASAGLKQVVVRLDDAIAHMQASPVLSVPDVVQVMAGIREDALLASGGLLETVLARHERVQRDKEKGPWIERDEWWTLMPACGNDPGELSSYGSAYLHPIRILNAYSFLADLGRVRARVDDDGETD